MGENSSGWDGIYVEFPIAKAMTLVGMKIKEEKEYIDHIGMLRENVRYKLIGKMFHMGSHGASYALVDKEKKNFYYSHAVKFKQM